MTPEEAKEILETFNWIKVKKLEEMSPTWPDGNIMVDVIAENRVWKDAYFKLLAHHKEETEFLIAKVRGSVTENQELYKLVTQLAEWLQNKEDTLKRLIRHTKETNGTQSRIK